jgi:hypothetical protein
VLRVKADLSQLLCAAEYQLKAHTSCATLLGRRAQGNHVFPLAMAFAFGQGRFGVDDLSHLTV